MRSRVTPKFWPTSSSVIVTELPANKMVYVSGQTYEDDEAWSFVEYDDEWGYVRADMLRMISNEEIQAYADLIDSLRTPAPENTPAPSYNPDELSCYGYVTTDAVNFRTEPSSSSKRIRQMKKYALFIV